MNYQCCEICYDKILDEDESAADLWPDICGYAMKNNGYVKFKIENGLGYELKILEELGFITSCENDENLKIRVEGYWIDIDQEHYFCIDADSHD